MKAKVSYNSTISFYVDVEIPDDTPKEDHLAVAQQLAEDWLDENGMPSVCAHCDDNFDIGEFYLDESEAGVWYPDGLR